MRTLPVISNHLDKLRCKSVFVQNKFKKKFDRYEEELFACRKNGKHLVLGKKPGSQSLILQNNDYLSLSKHPAIVAAQIASLNSPEKERMMSGVFLHEGSARDAFERDMAEYVGFESAILSQSGWAANVGLVQVIADATTPVYIDFYAHMSLWEGITSAGAAAYPFKHNSMDALERLMKKHGPGIVMVDSVYSTTGTLAPLVDIVYLAQKYDCVIVVDESHSLGVYGPEGAGVVAMLNLSNQVHFITASMAKAFSGRAGIIFCNEQVARCFPFAARPSIFSSMVLDLDIAALAATLPLIKAADDDRQKLHQNAHQLRQGLKQLGFSIDSQSQIVSIASGTEAHTERFRDALEDRDIFGSVFCAPATPKNRPLLRFSVNCSLQSEQIDKVLEVCAEVRDEVGMWEWRSTRQQRHRNSQVAESITSEPRTSERMTSELIGEG